MSNLIPPVNYYELVIVAEQAISYGKRRRIYDTILSLLEKLPAPVIDHYKILLKAEVEIRNRGSAD